METAGDCYIVAGALMEVDDEGFMTLDLNGDARHGARNVVNFGQVRGGDPRLEPCMASRTRPSWTWTGSWH